MLNYRLQRINEDMRRELSQVLRKVKDPRVGDDITVLHVDVTNDLSVAKVFISSLYGEDNTKEAIKGLRSAQGFIRTQLAQSLKLRKMPELRFIVDNSTNEFFHIDSILKKVLPDEDNDTGSK